MEHTIVRIVTNSSLEVEQACEWARSTPDGALLDLDIFAHQSTFLLSAMQSGQGKLAYCPVQQPLMMENLIFKPGLRDRDRALAMTRMAEHAIAEAYRRDVGEIYFLCRDASTLAFADRHKFTELPAGMQVRRLNLLETFGQ